VFGKKKTEEVKKEEQKYTWQQNVALYLHDMICMLVAVMAVLMLFLRIIVVDGPSMERTLLNGDYYFNVVLKYGSSVNGVDVSRLENTPYKASITVRLIQFSQFAESGTKTDLLGSSDCNLTLGDSLTYLYLRENLFLDNFRMGDDENFTRFQKGNMVTYLQNKVDDLILAWDSSVADLSVSSVPAEKQISTEYYSGQRFTALCDTAAKIDYVIKTESRYSKVYAFTTDDFGDTPYLAGNGGGEGKDVADCMMLISGTDYHSADFNIKGAGSITVGLYKR